jgi:hypothetical protein
MLHFNHLLTAGGGLLHVADTYEEHAAQLREALGAPHPEGCVSERSLRFTEAFIRPFGLDEPATPRMVQAVEELPERSQPARRVSLTGTVLARWAGMAVERRRRRRTRAKLRRARKATKAAAITASGKYAAARAKDKEMTADEFAARVRAKAARAKEKERVAKEKQRAAREKALIYERKAGKAASSSKTEKTDTPPKVEAQ